MAKSNASDSEPEEMNSGSGSDSVEPTVEPQKTGTMNEYEKQRLKRIQENKARMEAMGLHKMANSLMDSVQNTQKKVKDRKGKKKVVDEDEDYEPAQSEDLSSASDEDFEQENVVSKSQVKKSKKKTQTPKKRASKTKFLSDSHYVDDDDDLMQAIALSLGFQHNSNKVPIQETYASPVNKACNEKASFKTASKEKEVGSSNQEDTPGKKKRKQQTRNRFQMTEDDLILHFFQFDEAGKGSISLRDLRRVAASNDFTWSDLEMANMISCFDSNGDGKLSLDDFRKIVVRCNMIKGAEDAAT